jgi:hypothetical protein
MGMWLVSYGIAGWLPAAAADLLNSLSAIHPRSPFPGI